MFGGPAQLAISAAAARLSSNERPVPTSLMAWASSMPLMSLTTYPLAPANIASSIASSEVNDVSIKQRKFGSRDSRSLHSSLPVAVGQPHVEHRDVGLKGRDAGQSLGYRSGLAHHVEFGVRAEEVDESPPDDLVVVDEKDC